MALFLLSSDLLSSPSLQALLLSPLLSSSLTQSPVLPFSPFYSITILYTPSPLHSLWFQPPLSSFFISQLLYFPLNVCIFSSIILQYSFQVYFAGQLLRVCTAPDIHFSAPSFWEHLNKSFQALGNNFVLHPANFQT